VHLSFSAAGTGGDIDPCELTHHFLHRLFGSLLLLWWKVKEASEFCQICAFVSVGKKAKMAHSDKTLWQSMEEEASDKLNRIEGDGIDAVCFTILVGEGDQAIFE
jgi:hypothetical protein